MFFFPFATDRSWFRIPIILENTYVIICNYTDHLPAWDQSEYRAIYEKIVYCTASIVRSKKEPREMDVGETLKQIV